MQNLGLDFITVRNGLTFNLVHKMKTMKIKLILIACLFACTMLSAQVPQAFSYQAIAMDANGDLVTNSQVALEISVLADSPSGNVSYTESHLVMSSSLGHVNLEVGRGTATFGTFESVVWSTGPHFLEIKMDVSGGTDYQIVGTVQLLSVPYALIAEESLSGIQGPSGISGALGDQGIAGPTGPTGLPGQPGSGIGPAGPTGATGDQGAQGPPGPKGPVGPADGYPGPAGPQGIQGPPGDPSNIQGPVGPPGPTGPAGAAGAIGPAGDPGDPGIGGGIPGPIGDIGPQGPFNGLAGANGLPGANGAAGAAGPVGDPGAAGPDGILNMEMMSTPPPTNGWFQVYFYLDSGANRADGQPGFRFYVESTGTYVDL